MDKLDIICFSVNNWEKRKARKQQFMQHLSLRDDVGKVMYVEPPVNLLRILIFPFSELKTAENRSRWKRALSFKVGRMSESEKLFLYTPVFLIPFSFKFQFIYNLNLHISFLIITFKISRLGFNNSVLWLYHPFDYPLLRWFKKRVLSVFDWAEEWREYFIEFSERKRDMIRALEENIIKNTEIVFVVSQKLLVKAQKSNKNSYRLLDGTVYEIFRKTPGNVPEDIKYVKKPILGYLGTINERVDLNLLEFIGKNLANTSLVLIGDIHYRRIDISRFKKCNTENDNIYFLGGKSYEELGNYTQFFDVCILPYKPELSASIFPTKIFDYLATGSPIVSTNVMEIERFKDYLYIATSKEEFLNYVKIALNEKNHHLSQARLEVAQENSWGERASEIMEHLKERAHFE
jgi:hypothetical protein